MSFPAAGRPPIIPVLLVLPLVPRGGIAVVPTDLLLLAQEGGSWWWWLPPTLNILILVIGAFLILLVLIQKGKGGGLAGAFGGVGGSSAFGSRAGDLFTRITICVAAVWILLIMVQVKVIQSTERTPDNEAIIQR